MPPLDASSLEINDRIEWLNCYRELSTLQLWAVSRRILDEIRRPGPKTKAERADLTQQVERLVVSLMGAVQHTPGNPEYQIKQMGGKLAATFQAYHDLQRARLRCTTFSKAAEFVFGNPYRAATWAGSRTNVAIHESEEALVDALAKLQLVWLEAKPKG